MKEYVNAIPKYLVQRFISADQKAVVVSGRVPDLDSSQILPVVEKLDPFEKHPEEYDAFIAAVIEAAIKLANGTARG